MTQRNMNKIIVDFLIKHLTNREIIIELLALVITIIGTFYSWCMGAQTNLFIGVGVSFLLSQNIIEKVAYFNKMQQEVSSVGKKVEKLEENTIGKILELNDTLNIANKTLRDIKHKTPLIKKRKDTASIYDIIAGATNNIFILGTTLEIIKNIHADIIKLAYNGLKIKILLSDVTTDNYKDYYNVFCKDVSKHSKIAGLCPKDTLSLFKNKKNIEVKVIPFFIPAT